jgi:integrase
LADGIDPGVKRQAEREAQADTFEAVAREWLAKQTWVPHYRSKVEAWFTNDIFPWIGSRPVAEVAAPEFLRCARRMESRGAVESAHRMLQNCGQVMRYAVATSRADRNPVTDLRGALASPTGRHHAAITDPKEIGALLRAIDAYHGSLPTKIALQLAPLVYARPFGSFTAWASSPKPTFSV